VNQFYRRKPQTNIWPDIGSRFAPVKLVHRSGDLSTHPWSVTQPTGQSLKLGWGYGSVCGGGAPPPPPRGAQQSAARPASCLRSVCSDFRQVIPFVSVTPMPWQRNLNLGGSQLSSSESQRPLDVSCYISLHSARSACRLTALGRTNLRCQERSSG
jgi:hypothetical protein